MPKKPVEEKIAGNFTHKHILSLDQFDTKSLDILFKTTEKIIQRINQNKPLDTLAGKIITLLFFEPSSRTFASFGSAAKKLGAQTLDFPNPMQTSSAVKGESLEDTINTLENYSDLIVMRHFEVGAAKRAAEVAHVPLINAGDGKGEHPTQALLDLYTIYKQTGRLHDLQVLIAGDLLNGRTVHSLLKGLAMYKKNTVFLLSPKSLRLSDEYKKKFARNAITLVEIDSDKEIPHDCHVWYWTRVQKERFKNHREYEKVKNRFILTPALLKERGNNNMIIMHPLPRVNEIDTRVDSDLRAAYLRTQMKNGWYVRMALLSLIFGEKL